MMKYRKQISALLLPFFICSAAAGGCSTENETVQTSDSPAAQDAADQNSETADAQVNTTESTSAMQNISSTESTSSMTLKDITYDPEDLEDTWDENEAISITFDGSSAISSGEGAVIENGLVTISAAGTYILTGQWTDGQIKVNAGSEDTVRLILNGVDLSCSSSSVLYGEQSGKIIVTLSEGTSNQFSDASSYVYEDTTEEEPNAALFSKDDLVINGTGSLDVTGNYQDGIRSKDGLTLVSGTIKVTAAEDGIKGKDSVTVKEAALTVDAGSDGIQSSNDTDTEKGYVCIEGGSFHITSGNDGIQSQTLLQVTGGTFELNTGGTSSNAAAHTESGFGQRGFDDTNTPSDTASAETDATSESDSSKGLKSSSGLYITGGTFTIDSADDSVHSNQNVRIDDGTFTILTGDDGIHADASLSINGGTIDIQKSYEGLEGQTIDIGGGDIHLTATDDGVNAAGGNDSSGTGGGFGRDTFAADDNAYIRISGGTLFVDASGDGLDSNGNLYIDGGTTLVCGPTSTGNGALDYNGTAVLTGGYFIAAGSLGMTQSFSDSSTQASISYNYDSLQTAGTLLNLSSENGTSIASFAPSKDYQNVVISTPELKTGTAYTLSAGGTSEGTDTDGNYGTASYSGGTLVEEITVDSIVTSAGAASGGMNGQGMHGGGMGRGMRDIETEADASGSSI